jgi:hypothetical protein
VSGKIASMKVQVSADTSGFDAGMARVRHQMKGVQQAASITGGAGFGPLGGRVGAAAGMLSLSGPMLAVSAATAALAAAIGSIQRDQDRGRENLGEIVGSRLSIDEQARFKRVAEMASPGGSAGDMAAMLKVFRDADPDTFSKMVQAGASMQQLAAISGGTDAEAMRLLVELSRSPNGLAIAEALGGKAGGTFASLANIAKPELVSQAMLSRTSGDLARSAARDEIARQTAAATTDPNEPGFGTKFLRAMSRGSGSYAVTRDIQIDRSAPVVEGYLRNIEINTARVAPE